jgi:hypothetical protein
MDDDVGSDGHGQQKQHYSFGRKQHLQVVALKKKGINFYWKL